MKYNLNGNRENGDRKKENRPQVQKSLVSG